MSHTVTVATEVKNARAIAEACRRLGLAPPVAGNHKLYDGTRADGLAVQFPGWQYPCVFAPEGKALYDNFRGLWGDEKHLKKFLQAYAVASVILEARALGRDVFEDVLPDGSIRVRVPDGDARSVVMTADAQGDAKVVALGFQGCGCKDATAFAEKALGRALKDDLAPAYYESTEHVELDVQVEQN